MGKIGRNSQCPCGSGKKYKLCCGKKTIPQAKDVAGYYKDENTKTLLVFTKDILLNQIYRDSPIIAKSFDQVADKELKKVSELLAEALSIITPQYFLHINDQESWQGVSSRLLNHACTNFIASIEIARKGYRKQYGSLIRGTIETISTVFYICRFPEGLRKYNKGTLKSSKTLAAANQIIPDFSKLYGIYSNQFVHINKFHEGLGDLTKYKKNEEALVFILANMKLICWLIYVAAEFAFLQKVSKPRYFEIVGAKAIAYNPSKKEREWLKGFLGDHKDLDNNLKSEIKK